MNLSSIGSLASPSYILITKNRFRKILLFFDVRWNYYRICVVSGFRRGVNEIFVFNNFLTRCDLFSLLHFCRQLYMFRVLTAIIRSWYSCNYSFWYWLTGSTTIRSHCWVVTDSYPNNCPTRCDFFSSLHFCRQLYMFQVLTPIIRSSYNSNYSFWYWLTGSTTIRSRCWVGYESVPTQRERMVVDPVNQYQKL